MCSNLDLVSSRYYGFWYRNDIADVGNIRYLTYRNNLILEMAMAGKLVASMTESSKVTLPMNPISRLLDLIRVVGNHSDLDDQGTASHQGALDGRVHVGVGVRGSLEKKRRLEDVQPEF